MYDAAMATLIEKNLSDFLRGSGKTLRDVERHDVVLHRRDGEDLLLTEKRREDGMRETFQLLASLVQSFMGASAANGDHVAEVLDRSAPWALVMPREEQERFLQEIAQKARACDGLGSFEPLTRLFESWQTTAWVYAHPEVLEQLNAEPDAEEARAVVARPAG